MLILSEHGHQMFQVQLYYEHLWSHGIHHFPKGKVINYCEDAANLAGGQTVYTSKNGEQCGFSKLSHVMWVGGQKLAALVADEQSTDVYELRLSKTLNLNTCTNRHFDYLHQ